MSMMLVLATVRYERVTLASRVRQLVAVPGKISYGEAKARLLGSCITTHPWWDRLAVDPTWVWRWARW